MASLSGTAEKPQETNWGEDLGNEAVRDPAHRKSTKWRRSRRHRNSGGPEGSVQSSSSGQVREVGQALDGLPADGKQDILSPQEDHRSRFYKYYRREADGYDREFMDKHDGDLSTALIFAGLFSAVTSVFIIDVQSQLRPDPNSETAALLRVLIHKIDNTTFGNDPPTLPQWTGPPHMIIQVQAVLYASLATSLLSAFLAMLGKQWLNRYASTDLRGTAIEHSQNRQRKLDGIVTWYFDHVIESLALMLQAALLLLGCALSRYLWDINIAVASVVLGVTSFGITFYIFIIVAGTAFENCPYQTPGSYALRYLWPIRLRSAPSAPEQGLNQYASAKQSNCCGGHCGTVSYCGAVSCCGAGGCLCGDRYVTFLCDLFGGHSNRTVLLMCGRVGLPVYFVDAPDVLG